MTCVWVMSPLHTCAYGLFPRALVAQRIEQKTFRLLTPSPQRTRRRGSGGEVSGRAIGVN